MPIPQGGMLIDPNKQQSTPPMPPMRTFIVTRPNPVTAKVEQITVHAHTVHFDKDTLSFISGWISNGEIHSGITRLINGWNDVEEAELRGSAPVAH